MIVFTLLLEQFEAIPFITLNSPVFGGVNFSLTNLGLDLVMVDIFNCYTIDRNIICINSIFFITKLRNKLNENDFYIGHKESLPSVEFINFYRLTFLPRLIGGIAL
jgi:hypothetical protein